MNVITALKARGETVATAESLTGGLVCAELTSVPGASAVVRGGLIVYATELKHELAGVDETLLDEHGAVHPEVARQLAEGARRTCGATWGLGLTGVAGPDPQDGVEPGTVHIAIAGPEVSCVRTITVRGNRHAVRSAAVENALLLLAEHLPMTGSGEH
ncbi:CinA family protein [Lentzea tibetensis]|uniref:CinA family protein n=1 Tax=Lentzea tibetensis TaxID=2591470 RepID=A0A563ERK6_9PSEU|nr:CinA family protein [Lentzea tibetensis]TWP50222.1 CinA family protein [Lentzea tibetensis]